MKKDTVIKIAITMFVTGLLCLLWQGLEMMIYGVVETRVVDTIMMYVMIPFIHCTVAFAYDQIKAYKNSRESDVNIKIVIEKAAQTTPANIDNYERD